MHTLYYHTACPLSRTIKITLIENEIPHNILNVNFWNNHNISPSGSLPTLITAVSINCNDDQYIDNSSNQRVDNGGGQYTDKFAICGVQPIIEYIDEAISKTCLMPTTPRHRAYIRFLMEWFNCKMYNEVTKPLMFEKIIKGYVKIGAPNSSIIISAKQNAVQYLDYIEQLLNSEHSYVYCKMPGIIDYTIAAHISVLDYLNDVPWDNKKYSKLREWYALMKSRPSLRDILNEKVCNIMPPRHYNDPDF